MRVHYERKCTLVCGSLAADAQMATPADAEAAIPNASRKPPVVDPTIVRASGGRTRLWFSDWKRAGDRPNASGARLARTMGADIAPAGPLSACYSSQPIPARRERGQSTTAITAGAL